MSMNYCHIHDRHWDSDEEENCKYCEEEFDLSKKRKELFNGYIKAYREPTTKCAISIIQREIVLQDKEFIERLKEQFNKRTFFAYNPDVEKESSMKIIDKLAGDKLI